jgi:hypothetical protein
VWGASVAAGELDNIVWGTQLEADNIVWGTSGEVDNIVWGTSSESDNITWGCSGEDTPVFDDPDTPSVFDGVLDIDGVFGTSGDVPPAPATTTIVDPLVATTDSATSSTTVTTTLTSTMTILGGGL